MHRLAVVVASLVLVLACSSCDPEPQTQRTWAITVEPSEARIDVPVETEVTGGEPGDEVTLDAWMHGIGRSWATFVVPDDRRVVLGRDAAVAGNYEGVDAMGLFWAIGGSIFSLEPAAGGEVTDVDVTITVEYEQVNVATAQVVRRLHDPLDRIVATPSEDEGESAILYSPPGGCPCPTVMVLGGSEGGIEFSRWPAMLLASEGFAAVAVAYFGVQGKPENLEAIPVEEVSAALDWVLEQGPAREPVAVIGYSRGSELALQAAVLDPRLRAAVGVVPSGVRWPALPTSATDWPTEPAWTVGGLVEPFLNPTDYDDGVGDDAERFERAWRAALADTEAVAEATIPVERIDGPVLLGSGEDDQVWPSAFMAEAVSARLAAADHPHEVLDLTYPAAGHDLSLPNVPTVIRSFGSFSWGGSDAGAAAANIDWWGELLAFLDRHLCADTAC